MARDTRQRILLAALALFNEEGEPNVPTNRVAESLDISPGNLHYHFRTKADLVAALFSGFEHRMLELLAAPEERDANIEDIWFLLHLAFETIGDYRFIYRDLTDLCHRYRGLHQRFRGILRLTMQSAQALCSDLIAAGQMQASPRELDAIVRNITLVSTFWLAFDQVQDSGNVRPERAVWQVMSLVHPYLIGESKAHLHELAQAYE
ncbi:MAG: TetR/AcrR family transcriptional regulator [Wenzhouxiangella sp.]|jgi:AcrR family transcriptional regulator|nr:TetR/AcrR family transcriptional regulator [Wenzhouxiangella sp.]